MVRFIHCADLHLGRRFSFVANKDKAGQLYLLRLDVLDRIAELAADPARPVDFVLIAGDFFESHGVDDDLVRQACTRLDKIKKPVFLMPGNHDYWEGGPQACWRRAAWTPGERVTMLCENRPYPAAEGRALLLPGVIFQRHERTPCEWFRDAPPAAAPDRPVRIGVAHGTLPISAGVGDSDSSTVLNVEGIVADGALDYLALGDWHGARKLEVKPRAWYSGAPEPTGFGQANSGGVLRVTLDGPGATPVVEPLAVARTQWLTALPDAPDQVFDEESVTNWIAAAQALPNPELTCLKTQLGGRLEGEPSARLQAALANLRANLLHDDLATDELTDGAIAARLDELAAGDGLLARVIADLRATAEGGGEDAGHAREALRQLPVFVPQEVRS